MLLFNNTTGLKTVADPTRLPFDPAKGNQALAACKNIDIDDTGRISRRKGTDEKVSGDYHSGFSCGNYALCITGDALSVFEPSDYSVTAIRQITPGLRMSYVKVADKIYYTNTVEVGYVKDRVSYSWTAPTYVGHATVKNYSNPPAGHIITFFNGQIYIAINNYFYCSELNSRNWFEMAEGYYSESSRIRMIAPVDGGLFVSNGTEILFYGGTNSKDLSRKVVADYPAIEGAYVPLMMSQVGNLEMGYKAVLIASERGICLGLSDGSLNNLTEDTISYPSANFGSCIYKNRKLTLTLQP